jgi:hypothetical protein
MWNYGPGGGFVFLGSAEIDATDCLLELPAMAND